MQVEKNEFEEKAIKLYGQSKGFLFDGSTFGDKALAPKCKNRTSTVLTVTKCALLILKKEQYESTNL
jgi:CRP-like cAMP-binding protein